MTLKLTIPGYYPVPMQAEVYSAWKQASPGVPCVVTGDEVRPDTDRIAAALACRPAHDPLVTIYERVWWRAIDMVAWDELAVEPVAVTDGGCEDVIAWDTRRRARAAELAGPSLEHRYKAALLSYLDASDRMAAALYRGDRTEAERWREDARLADLEAEDAFQRLVGVVGYTAACERCGRDVVS